MLADPVCPACDHPAHDEHGCRDLVCVCEHATIPPPDLTPDYQRLRAEHDRLQAANDAALQALADRGVSVAPGFIAGTRLEALTDHLLGPATGPDATQARLVYELAVQHRFTTAIAEIQTEVRKQQLLAGVTLPAATPGNGRPHH